MSDISKIALGGSEYNLKDTGCREGLALLETVQRALSSDQTSIDVLSTSYELTTDTKFLRYKGYYAYDSSNDTYTHLVLGTDYNVGDTVDQTAVYELIGNNISEMRSRLNSVITIVNSMMPAHRAEAAPTENNVEQEADTGDGSS